MTPDDEKRLREIMRHEFDRVIFWCICVWILLQIAWKIWP
jgi:hypothetical protein